MNTGTVILLVGVGAAAFLYWRSQQQQAAALAAAKATPAPGILQKLQNSLSVALHQGPTAAAAAVSGVTTGLAGAANSAVGFVKGIF